MTTREEAAQARGEAVAQRSHRPSQRRAAEDPEGPRQRSTVRLEGLTITRGKTVENGDDGTHVIGMASVTERGYDMWDEYGPYTEVVALDAFDATLATNPAVEFTLNHNRGGGAPMAATWNQTLLLEALKTGDVTGLHFDANVDATRNDVGDLVKAFQRGDQREASFKFGITRGLWSPDYTQFRIEEVDLDGGDVTSANFGANPFASSGLRSAAPKPGSELVTERDLALPMQSLI